MVQKLIHFISKNFHLAIELTYVKGDIVLCLQELQSMHQLFE